MTRLATVPVAPASTRSAVGGASLANAASPTPHLDTYFSHIGVKTPESRANHVQAMRDNLASAAKGGRLSSFAQAGTPHDRDIAKFNAYREVGRQMGHEVGQHSYTTDRTSGYMSASVKPISAASPSSSAPGRFNEARHPRGGRSENKGEFSLQPGAKTGQPSGQQAGQPPGQSAGQQPPKPAAGQGLASGQPGAAQPAATPEEHAQRHDFTKSQLASVAQPIQGIMAALHAHPDVRSGGSVVEQAVAPNQARQAYAFLGHNVGQNAGGGQAVDLGEGRLGFASPAGSMIVWPADSSGHHQVKYTNQTGLVNRAMSGQGGRPATPPSPPAGGNATPMPPVPVPPGTPPPVAGVHGAPATEPFLREPPVIAEPPQFAIGAQGRPMSAAAGQAASALTEKPQTGQVRVGGPPSPREVADDTRRTIEVANAKWQEELAGGISKTGQSKWRSYLHNLNSLHHSQERVAKIYDREQQIAAKGDKGLAKLQYSPEELEAQKANPQAFKDLQKMRREWGMGDDAYADSLKQIHTARNPFQAQQLEGFAEGSGETRAQRNPPIAGGKQPEQWRHAGDAFRKPGAESAAMQRAGIDPQSGKPRETKQQIEARLRREASQPGFSVPPPPKSQPIEGSNQWKALVKQKAEEWDMQPQDFHSLAKDLHKELSEHLGQREAAKQAARKMTHLSQADINRLENQGFDSGSKHQRIKQLDTIGRELASEYPSLGWGRGRDEESGEDAGFDYAEHLWDLIREGAKKVPSPTSPEFMEHVEGFLHHHSKSHGSSGVAGGHAAEGEDLSAVPFAKVRKGRLRRYSTAFVEADHPRLKTGEHGPRGEHGGEFQSKSGHGFHSEQHAALADQLHEHLRLSAVSGSSRTKYHNMLAQVIGQLPARVSRLASQRIEQVRFFNTPQALTKHTTGKTRLRGGVVGLGGWRLDSRTGRGVLFLDGGKDEWDTEHTYLHELGHVVDFDAATGNGMLSNTKQWQTSWKKEIDRDGNALDEYARTDAHEGFAEFARLAWSDPEKAESLFPACWSFWKSEKLI